MTARRFILALDQGTTGSRARGGRSRRRGAGERLRRAAPALSPAGLGGARRRGDLADARLEAIGAGAGRRPHHRRRDRRDRHHESARDLRAVGARLGAPGSSRHRLAVPPHGALLRAPQGRGRRARVQAQDGPHARPVLLRHQDPLAARRGAGARERGPSAASSPSAPWTRGFSGGSPAAPSTRPIRPMPRARSASTSTRSAGTRSCARSSASRRRVLPAVKPSAGVFGETAAGGLPAGIPVTGIAGDQQSALFGQCCLEPGMAKNTYGTGCFLLLNTGSTPIASERGLLTTVAWQLDGAVTYALEGSVFIGGRRRPVAARRARRHRHAPPRARASPCRWRTPAASIWCPPSPALARPTGTPMRAASSSG